MLPPLLPLLPAPLLLLAREAFQRAAKDMAEDGAVVLVVLLLP